MKNCKLSKVWRIIASLSTKFVLISLISINTFALSGLSSNYDGGDDDDDDHGGGNWSTKGNTIHHNYSFGTKNAFPILFKTNNIQRMVLTTDGFLGINVSTPLAPLHTNGDVIFNTLIGTGIGLVYTGADGKISRYSFTGNNRHVLLGDGTFGEYSDNDWKIDGNNIYNQNTGNVGVGGIPATEYKLDVYGDAKVRGEFSVGNSIRFNGITDQITTTTGNLDFGTTNLSTEGTIKTNSITSTSGTLNLGSTNISTLGSISAAGTTFTGSSTFDNISVNNTTTTSKLTANGVDVKNAIRFTEASSAIVSSGDLNVESQGNIKFNTPSNTIINSKTGIGIDHPIEMLDVNGNANIRGYLYVQNGVIIGQRIQSERLMCDTVKVAELIEARELAIDDLIKVPRIEINEAKLQTINIDGINSKITSSTGGINFDNDNIITSGSINAQNITSTGTLTANNINISGATSFENLTVNNGINLGKELIFTGAESKINSPYNLLLQNDATSGNTILNLNSGKVGIGIANPVEMLDVNGNLNVRGYLYVQDGVIIGQRMEGEIIEATERINSKRISAERMSADTLKISQEIISKRLEATEAIRNSNINIDGLNSTISSTTGNINFDDENLTTTGTVNAGTISATTIEANNLTITNPISLTDLTVTDKLTVGTNTLILSSAQGSTTVENSIYSESGDLKIQSNYGTTNNTILNNNGGNVGIGNLTTIDAKLHVAGDVKIESLPDDLTGTLKMLVADSDGKIGSKNLTLNSLTSGNVGIGITTPTQIDANAGLFAGAIPKLEILTGSGNSPYAELVTIRHNTVDGDADNDRALGLILKMSNENVVPYNESAKMGGIMLESLSGFSNNPSLFLLTNNQRQVELKSNGDFKLLNGKMGIGTNNLIAKLNIGGSIIIEGPDLVLGTNDTRAQGAKLQNRALVHDGWQANSDNLVINYDGDFEDGVFIQGPKTIIEGNLGIGCSNPTERLTVDGKIKVKDEIIIDEVGDWSDYVFDKDYKMLSIPELENYINENKHLPNIPSAKVVETEGLHIMDMNRRMMEKIEELTLYIIDLEKRLKEVEIQKNK